MLSLVVKHMLYLPQQVKKFTSCTNSVQVAYLERFFQVILNKGDIGHHMYFISMGEVEILPNKDAAPLATLKEGDMFGEVHHSTNTPTVTGINDYCFMTHRSTWFIVCRVQE